MNGKDEIYRTVCLKTIELLLSKQITVKKEKEQTVKNIENFNSSLEELESNIGISGKLKQKNKKQIENEIAERTRKIDAIKRKTEILRKFVETCERFISSVNDIDKIEIAIQSLRVTYEQLGKQTGNISLFVALVYFKLFDDNKFNDFVKWIIRNGINKICLLYTSDAADD